MNFAPLLLVLLPFALAFLIEATTIYFFKLRGLWASIGLSVVINLLVIVAVVFAVMPLLGRLNYGVSALQFPLPVAVFLCWLSILLDGLLLRAFIKNRPAVRVFAASAVMNVLSWVVLFIIKDL